MTRHKNPQYWSVKICSCGSSFEAYKPPCSKTYGMGKFCSRACADKYHPSKFKSGTDHPFYRTGTYVSDNQIRRSYKYISWVKTIYKRDGFTCQICGTNRKLRANHIKRFSEYPELRFDTRNGVTICNECDFMFVLRREEEWESYFNFNLKTRGLI